MNQNPQRRPDVEVVRSADGYLAHVPGSPLLTWLNSTGYVVLELCTGANDAALISRALMAAFDLYEPPTELVRSTIAELVAAGLVSPGETIAEETHSLDIAVWAPGSSIDADALSTVHALIREAEAGGIATTLTIDRDRSMRGARNRAANRFLNRSDATHALFLDALPDPMIAISGCDIVQLIGSEHEAIGIPVPIGEPRWEAAMQAARAMPGLSTRDLEAFARGYDVSINRAPELADFEAGFIEGRHCSSGALLLRRTALERIAGSELANRHRGNVRNGVVGFAEGRGFFDTGLSGDFIDIDEDLAFCERMRGAGGQVMIDLSGDLGTCLHIGMRLQGRA